VYKGKTINNEDTVEKLGIKETDFLVVMTQVQVTNITRRNPNPNLKRKSNPKPSK
jgi:hypothetical protein